MVPRGPDREDAAKRDVDTEVDVSELLRAVVDKPPPPDMADRVMSRLALVETVVEFGRLLGLVPAEAATEHISDEDAGSDDGR